MTGRSVRGAVDAARARPWFDLQLRFAERLAEERGAPLAETVALNTNLHRRFGLGHIAKVAPDERWRDFLDAMARAPDHAARLDLAVAEYAASPPEPPPEGQHTFGCFACEPPDADGRVRIHFHNRDADAAGGPLAAGKRPRRREDLARLTAFIAASFPGAKSVRGGSWLYQTAAYRELFPPAYIATLRPARADEVGLSGMSSWGQFINAYGRFRPQAGAAFEAAFDRIDPEAPHLSFPLPVLIPEAPFSVFKEAFGDRSRDGTATRP